MAEVERITEALKANWVWVPEWQDSAPDSAGRLVHFTRTFQLEDVPTSAMLHCSADTRYKLIVNGARIAVGPTRSSPSVWYYDTIDLAPWLRRGSNVLVFMVLRYFAASRAAMPFVRTAFPGLTVTGRAGSVVLDTSENWSAEVQNHIQFPTGLADDVFLHINERVNIAASSSPIVLRPYGFKSLNGDLLPWRLRPRVTPMPEQTPVRVDTIRHAQSPRASNAWEELFARGQRLSLPANSSHLLHVQAECHSTAFTRWTFRSAKPARVHLKITYSEGYELEPRLYPWLRTKADRLDSSGLLLGPHDDVFLLVDGELSYEPFWFRTFRLLRVEVETDAAVDIISLVATQTNYPMDVKARWKQTDDPQAEDVWSLCIRTMRNCMFDGYSDCPFYEQLQYSGDTRSVALFHYLLSGDDRLMRQAIVGFAASVTPEGLTQSRFPSYVQQVILGFPLYWILSICDHHLYFGDIKFTRSFLPLIDGVLEFFAAHVDELGLVSGFPSDVWQYVDWVDTWSATAEHPDKGVPTSGRKSNRHTYFSMLYAYVLRQTASLLAKVGRRGYEDEYNHRADAIVQAIRKHCYDGHFFTDSTTDIADKLAYSQHCQVFAVLCGAAEPADSPRLLLDAFSSPISKCSYVMMFYAFRAFAQAGSGVYEKLFLTAWAPWRGMLANNLSTLEEDDVRQRSDCHAWGAVPIYEYCVEVAGVQPLEPGCSKILFAPRLSLSSGIEAEIMLGRNNAARVEWITEGGVKLVSLRLSKDTEVVSQLPGGKRVEQGSIHRLELAYEE